MCADASAPSGIERAVFGEVDRGAVDEWLHQQVRERIGVGVHSVRFRSGRASAVYGLDLDDGRAVVMKVSRPTPDTALELGRLGAVVTCQRHLVAQGFPCPAPVDGPWAMADRICWIQQLLSGDRSNGHDPTIRDALAISLAEQVMILRSCTFPALGSTVPAWLDYGRGPWPAPHDPIFDFTRTPPRYLWLDRLAADAADGLRLVGADVVAHSDWTCGNVRFADGAVAAAYDWDSLVLHAEPVLAGLAAASFTQRSTAGPHSPAPDESASFLSTYDRARARPFSRGDQAIAAAAATWALAYNARCEITLDEVGIARDPGSALDALSQHGSRYLQIRW